MNKNKKNNKSKTIVRTRARQEHVVEKKNKNMNKITTTM